MSDPETDPDTVRAPHPGAAAASLIALGAAVLVLVLVVGWAGHDRGDAAPRSVDDVEAAIRAGGLVVCSSSPVGDPSGAGAIEARALEVGSTDAGELSAEGLDGDEGGTCTSRAVARVTVTRFVDVDARDAAARSLEGLLRPRGADAVSTGGDLLVVVDGTSEDAPRTRLAAVLDAAGLR